LPSSIPVLPGVHAGWAGAKIDCAAVRDSPCVSGRVLDAGLENLRGAGILRQRDLHGAGNIANTAGVGVFRGCALQSSRAACGQKGADSIGEKELAVTAGACRHISLESARQVD
jgi:hypothetical protein